MLQESFLDRINANGMKSFATGEKFICKYCSNTYSLFFSLLECLLFCILPFSIFNSCSLRLISTLDHFGYEAPYLKDWTLSTWYDQTRFNDWFATLRSNRRAKDIMPLLHEISSDDDDEEGQDRGGPSTGQPPAIQESPSNADSAPGPSSPPEEDRDKNSQPEGGEGSGGKDSQLETYTNTDTMLLRKMGFGRFFLLPHAMVIKGAGNMVYGSYDKRFSFVSQHKRCVPINPLTFVSGVNSRDFARVGMEDPRCEDINSIIAIAARGELPKQLLSELRKREDKIDDILMPSLFKRILGDLVTVTSIIPQKVEKRGFMKPIIAKYNKSGWVGPVDRSLSRKCKRLFPRTRQIGKMRIVPFPRVTKCDALVSSTFLREVLIHKDYPKRLLKSYGVSSK